ncbi:hypothetical protein C0989_008744 [Termitomyces sp. Mn162]|nr:hypothetical protein C0989_008744 [Termitomyces sp. Mn162]
MNEATMTITATTPTADGTDPLAGLTIPPTIEAETAVTEAMVEVGVMLVGTTDGGHHIRTMAEQVAEMVVMEVMAETGVMVGDFRTRGAGTRGAVTVVTVGMEEMEEKVVGVIGVDREGMAGMEVMEAMEAMAEAATVDREATAEMEEMAGTAGTVEEFWEPLVVMEAMAAMAAMEAMEVVENTPVRVEMEGMAGMVEMGPPLDLHFDSIVMHIK